MYYYEENSFSHGYTFDNFVVGEEKNPVEISIKNLIDNENRSTHYNPLFIVGDSGTGKTHILNAAAHELNKKFEKIKFLYITMDMFRNDIHESFSNKEIDKMKDYFNSLDFLLIDDFDQILGKKQTQQVFFSIFNNLHSEGKKIILASKMSIEEMGKFNLNKPEDGADHIDERIISRLMCGLTLSMVDYDNDMIISILRKKTAELNLSDEILQYIALNVNTKNIMKIDSVISRLMAYTVMTKKDITHETVRDLMVRMDISKGRSNISIDTILKTTAKFFTIDTASILGDSRRKEISLARHIAMYLAVKYTDLSQESIGQYFGGRNHSSVIYARNTIDKKIKSDENYKYYVSNIESSLEKS